jgi:hypothetical protein
VAAATLGLASHRRQLPGHPHDSGAGDRRDSGAQRHEQRRRAETEHAWDIDAVEVLGHVPQHVGVAAAGGKDVDQAKELRLEARVRHRPVEDPLAPAPEVEEPSALGGARFGDLARELLHLPFGRGGHGC